MQSEHKDSQQPLVSPTFQTTFESVKSVSKSFEQPTPRIFHTSITYKSYIFIYGGLSINPKQEFLNEHLFIYRFDMHRREWKKIQTNFPASINNQTTNPISNIYSHCCLTYGNVMYLFGGKTGRQGQCMNQLWAMNLESYNWRKQDQKGTVPEKREAASMILINKSHLFLYGGKNQEGYILNDMHIYKIESKQWFAVQTKNTQFLISQRLYPGICAVNDLVYIFGGQRQTEQIDQNGNMKFETLNDFYQVKIVNRTTSIRPDAWVKKIVTFLKPQRKPYIKLLNCSEKLIIHVSSNGNAQNDQQKLWIYDPSKVKWTYSIINNPQNLQLGIGFSAKYHYDRLYLFGGLHRNLSSSNFLSVYIQNDIKPSIINLSDKRLFDYERQKYVCYQCQQDKKSIIKRRLQDYSFLSIALKNIEYPYSCFGLLIDNSVYLNATSVTVKYCSNMSSSSSSKQKCIVLEDDGDFQNLWANQDQFIQDMISFRTIQDQQMEIEDQEAENQLIAAGQMDGGGMIDENRMAEHPKSQILGGGGHHSILNASNIGGNLQEAALLPNSSKKQQEKEQQRKLKKKRDLAKKKKAKLHRRRKQFSINIKIGSMRLAKKMLYISRTPDGVRRVFLLEQKVAIPTQSSQKTINANNNNININSNSNQGQITYQCHYYAGLILSADKSQYTQPNFHSHYSSQTSKTYIQQNYKQSLKMVGQIFQNSATVKNCLVLIGLRQMTTEDGLREPQLKVQPKINDIYFGSVKVLSKAQSLGVILTDSIDVSLKSYLSLLYLKDLNEESLRISLSINDKQSDIITSQAYFKKVDNLLKTNAIMEIQKMVDLIECKIVQLYYYKDLSEKYSKKSQRTDKRDKDRSNIFFNGILIYHKNRLIGRYKHPLGKLIKYSEMKKVMSSKTYNPIKIFGFIELEQPFYSNIFKNKFVNDQNLQNMYSRFKFVENYLNKMDTENDRKQSVLDDKERGVLQGIDAGKKIKMN